MSIMLHSLAAVAGCAVLATTGFAQSAREIRGASPYNAIQNEPAPKLIVAPPIPDQLARGIVQIQYRVENVHIVPVFGAGALNVSPRVGHLHIQVDDVPWWWADASNINTIDVAGMPLAGCVAARAGPRAARCTGPARSGREVRQVAPPPRRRERSWPRARGSRRP